MSTRSTPRRLKASPKARKMWRTIAGNFVDVKRHALEPDKAQAYFVLPGSREDVERMVGSIAGVIAAHAGGQPTEWTAQIASAALATIGIRSRKERK